MDNFKVGDSVIGFYKINNEKIITNKSFIEFIDVRNRDNKNIHKHLQLAF